MLRAWRGSVPPGWMRERSTGASHSVKTPRRLRASFSAFKSACCLPTVRSSAWTSSHGTSRQFLQPEHTFAFEAEVEAGERGLGERAENEVDLSESYSARHRKQYQYQPH